MSFKFNYNNNNLDSPTVLLCTKSFRKLGVIANIVPTIIQNDNSADEVSFRVYKRLNNKECLLWDKIENLKLIWVKELDEYFEIKVNPFEEDSVYKDVIATSLCEAELSQIILSDIEINTESDIERDEYLYPTVFYDEKHKDNSLLNRILEKAPHYKIGHVDSSITTLQRSFSFDQISIYDALTSNISQEIGCIFKFDSTTRTINAYDTMINCLECGERFDINETVCPKCGKANFSKSYGKDTGIVFSIDNVAQNLSISYDVDEYKNCFRIKSGDELFDSTIRSINPNGSSYIYNITKFMSNDMSSGLLSLLEEYQKKYQEIQNTYSPQFSSEVSSKYNAIVDKYNAPLYANYQYNDNGDRVLANNSFLKTTDIKGYDNFTNLYFDTIDFVNYLESKLLPAFGIEETDASKEAEKLKEDSLSPIGLSSLSVSTSKSTIESAIKNYVKVLINGSFKISINTQSYDFIGYNDEGVAQGEWTGTITLQKYGVDDTATTPLLRIILDDDYALFMKQKIDKALMEDDEDSVNGSIHNIMEIPVTSDEVKLKEQLNLFCLNRLKSFRDAYQSGLDILIEMDQASEGADLYDILYLPYKKRLEIIETNIKVRTSEIDIIGNCIDEIESLKRDMQNSLDLESWLGNYWTEFCSYRREDVYENDNYISDGLNNSQLIKSARNLFNIAQKELFRSGSMSISISGTLANFISIKEFRPILQEFDVGIWVRVIFDNKVYKVRLSNYELDYNNLDNCNITFSDVIQAGKSTTQKILEEAKSMATSITYLKQQAVASEQNKAFVSNFVQNGLDLTNQQIVSSARNQSLLYNKNGILIRSLDDITNEFELTQMKIINSTIAITDDNWKSVKTAIGKFYYVDPITKEKKIAYGINAETIVGKIILGNELGIYSNDGSSSMSFDNYGLVLNSIDNGTGKYKRILDIQKDGKSQLYVDTDGNVVLANGQIVEITNAIDRITADYADFEKAYIKEATVKELLAQYATVENLNAINASIEKLKVDKADITELNVVSAKISELTAGMITTDYLKTNYAQIDLANIKNGCITTAMIGQGVIENVNIADGSITSAKIVELTANKISSGILDAAKIDVVNLNCANLTVGTINGQQIAPGAINWDQLSNNVGDTITTADNNATQALKDAIEAFNKAVTASNVATNALTTANGKNKAFYQETAPSGGIYTINDIWFNTAKNMQMAHWNGTSWEVELIGNEAIAVGAINADKIAADVTNRITEAFNTATNALGIANETSGKATYEVKVMYALANSEKIAPTSGWSVSAPSWTKGMFMWQKTVSTYGDGTVKESSPTCISGANGQNGTDGKGIKYIDDQYYLSTSNITQSGGSWKNTQDIWSDGKFIWTRSQISWSDNTITYTTPVLAEALNEANKNAITAKSLADSINNIVEDNKANWDKAGNALTTAQSAKTIADTVTQLVNSNKTNWDKAGTALDTANGKNTVFYQTSAPATSGRKVNDIWFDTDDGNKMYYWNGTAWTAQQFGTNAIKALSITDALIANATISSAKISSIDASKITSGYIAAARIQAGTITADHIASNAITSVKISAGSISTDKLAANAVTAAKIAAATITADKLVSKTLTAASGVFADACIVTANIANLAVTTSKIANLAVGNAQIANLAVNNAKIADLSITNTKIVDATIQSAKIAALDAGKITTGYLNAARIQAGTISGAHIASNTISADKLLISQEGYVRYPNFSNWTSTFPLGMSDWNSSTSRISKVAVNGINVIQMVTGTTQTGLNLNSSSGTSGFFSYGLSLDGVGYVAVEIKFRLVSGTNPTGAGILLDFYYKNTAGTTTSSRITGNLNEVGTTLTANTWYTYRKVFAIPDAVNAGQFQNLSGYLMGNYSGNGTATSKTIQFASVNVFCATYQDYLTQTWTSGTSINGGKIATNSITANQITASTITGTKIAAGTISAGNIATNAITADKIAANAVTAAKIAAATITGDKLVASTITGAKIAANTITATNIATNAITTDKLNANAVTAAKIATGTITATQIAANAITTDKIAASAITGVKIAAGTITAGNIAANAITADKIAANAITAAKIAADAIKSRNYVANSTGSFLNLADGSFNSKNLKWDSAGNLTCTSGMIGGWSIKSDRLIISQSSNIYMELVPKEMTIGLHSGGDHAWWTTGGINFQSGYTTPGGRYEYDSVSFDGNGVTLEGNIDPDRIKITRSGIDFTKGAYDYHLSLEDLSKLMIFDGYENGKAKFHTLA